MNASEESARLRAFGGRMLDTQADPELQQIVAEAARITGYPIALVSLMLDRTQVFRAQVGLPMVFATAGATDRDASLCQFVVESGQPFEVTNAIRDERIPKELRERLLVSAYHGVPLHVGEHVVGSLCVIDSKANQVTASANEALNALATRASERLSELQAHRVVPNVLSHALSPAFEEINNQLLPLFAAPETLRILHAQLAPIARLFAKVGDKQVTADELLQTVSYLVESANSYVELDATARMIEQAATKIAASVGALHKLINGTADSADLSDMISTATETTHHVTKLVGGVHWSGIQSGLRVGGLGVSPAVALAFALKTLCQRSHNHLKIGIDAVVRIQARHVHLELGAGLAEAECLALALELEWLLSAEVCFPSHRGVTLRFPIIR